MNIVQTKNRIQMYKMLDVDINFVKPDHYSVIAWLENTPGKG